MEMLILAGLLTLIAALLAYWMRRLWRNAMQRSEPPPLLTLLGPAQERLNPETTAVALRRCTFCSAGALCQQKLAAGEPIPDYCPNAGLLASLGKLRGT